MVGSQEASWEAIPDSMETALEDASPENAAAVRKTAKELRKYLSAHLTGPREGITPAVVEALQDHEKRRYTPVQRYVRCGKGNCSSCPHGPYLYLVRRIGLDDSDTEELYVGPVGDIQKRLSDEMGSRLERVPTYSHGDELDSADVGNNAQPEFTRSSAEDGNSIRDGFYIVTEGAVPADTGTDVSVTLSNDAVQGIVCTRPFAYWLRSSDHLEQLMSALTQSAGVTVVTDTDGTQHTMPVSEEQRLITARDAISGITDLAAVGINMATDPDIRTLRETAIVGSRDPWTQAGYLVTEGDSSDAALTRDESDLYPNQDPPEEPPRLSPDVLPAEAEQDLYMADIQTLRKIEELAALHVDVGEQQRA